MKGKKSTSNEKSNKEAPTMPRRSKCEDEKGKTRERKNGRLDFAVKKKPIQC
jgi:hypothetical protein